MKVFVDNAQSGGSKISVVKDTGEVMFNRYLSTLPECDGCLIFEIPGVNVLDDSNSQESVESLKTNGSISSVEKSIKSVAKKMAHNDHYARCGYCGWVGEESELPNDPKHECGKDKCPECGVENFIKCCFKTYDDAVNNDEKDIDTAQQSNASQPAIDFASAWCENHGWNPDIINDFAEALEKYSETLKGKIMSEKLYKCDYPGCNVTRTKAQGGKIFTVCDKHWDEYFRNYDDSDEFGPVNLNNVEPDPLPCRENNMIQNFPAYKDVVRAFCKENNCVINVLEEWPKKFYDTIRKLAAIHPNNDSHAIDLLSEIREWATSELCEEDLKLFDKKYMDRITQHERNFMSKKECNGSK